MYPIKTILVPLDFGDPSDAALDHALDLAEGLGASLCLLHAYQVAFVAFPDSAYAAPPEIVEGIGETARASLDRAVAKCAARKVEVRAVVRRGDPRHVVLEIAKEVGADLIVMRTHGRRGLSRAFLGSTTEMVVRTSDVPVLSVHGYREAA
jgi:nucleotide-binding universal stress UspA family protein